MNTKIVEDASAAVALELKTLSQFELLKQRISAAPTDPGVYRFKNRAGEVLYVGKAKNLRNRLKSYVAQADDITLGPWKRSMVKSSCDIEITITRSELEALILETNLIKEIKPKYNVLMKDDKNYVYIRISKDVYPSITTVRKISKDNAVYFGPYISSYNTRRLLEVIHTIWPFMAAKETIDTLNRFVQKKEPVPESLFTSLPLSVQIGKHCALGTPEFTLEQYLDNIEKLKRFLRGERRSITVQLEQQMQEAAQNRKFERAAKLRDSLQYIRSLEAEQTVSDTTMENTDYIGLAILCGHSQLVLMKEREGKLIAEQAFSFTGQSEDEVEVLQSFTAQYYSDNPDIPDVLVLPIEITETSVLSEWLTLLKGKKVEVRIPERGKKVQLLDLATKNAAQKVKQLEARFEAEKRMTEAALTELQTLLSLPTVPKRIEGYDISHFAGTETVGSMVVTKNGKAARDQYRRFTIQSLATGAIDDYASLKEVLTRRLLYLVNTTTLEIEDLKQQHMTITRFKKVDTATLKAICVEHTITLDSFSKDLFLLKKEEAIVAIIRLYTHDGLFELETIFKAGFVTNENYRTLIKFALQTRKNGKVYVCITPNAQEFWLHLGATIIQNQPSTLRSLSTENSVCVCFIMHKIKPDASLTSVPDLLMIDGGKGQLSTVVRVLESLQLCIPVIGLAKREEEIFVPHESEPILCKKDAPALFLLMRLRNEAHRFANDHRERRAAKTYITSALDEITSIGPTTKKRLLQEFLSIDGIKNATDTELLSFVSTTQLKHIRTTLAE